MIPALEPLFKGPLAPLGAWLALDDDPRPALSMAEYLNGDQLGDLLQRFAPQYASADQRGLVSLWGKYHFCLFYKSAAAEDQLRLVICRCRTIKTKK